MKRLFAVSLVVLVLILVGCAKKNDDVPDVVVTPGDGVVSSDTDVANVKPAEPVLGEITEEIIMMEGMEETVHYQKISGIGGVGSIKYDVDRFWIHIDIDCQKYPLTMIFDNDNIGNQFTIGYFDEIDMSEVIDDYKTNIKETGKEIVDENQIQIANGIDSTMFIIRVDETDETSESTGDRQFEPRIALHVNYFIPYNDGYFKIWYRYPDTVECIEGIGSRFEKMVETFEIE